MLPVYSNAVSGLQASQQSMDITANNIANVNTMGFDASDPTVEDLIYQNADARSLIDTTGTTALGVGARLNGAPRSLQPGAPVPTGNPLDVSITGDGFLQVLQTDGTIGYTRLGAIRLDAQSRFTVNGLLLQPPITLPPNSSEPFITQTGQVTVQTPTGQQVAGQIQLARFPNTQGLQAMGDTVYAVSASSGGPILGTPTQPGFGGLQPGALEAARVDLGREMSALIIAERSYGLNARALQTVDRMVGDVTRGR